MCLIYLDEYLDKPNGDVTKKPDTGRVRERSFKDVKKKKEITPPLLTCLV